MWKLEFSASASTTLPKSEILFVIVVSEKPTQEIALLPFFWEWESSKNREALLGVPPNPLALWQLYEIVDEHCVHFASSKSDQWTVVFSKH